MQETVKQEGTFQPGDEMTEKTALTGREGKGGQRPVLPLFPSTGIPGCIQE